MKPNQPKRKISQRETWLMALLPAALVVILSLALPGPAGEVAEMQDRLERLTGGEAEASMHKQLRDLATELKSNRQELAELETGEAAVAARIQSLQSPVAGRAFNMAEGLDELTRRLAGHGVQVLAMIEDGGSRQGKSAGGGASGGGSAARRDWQVSVAATWPEVREALADADTFPQGLALSALKMEPPRPNVPLQRWELIVSGSGAMP